MVHPVVPNQELPLTPSQEILGWPQLYHVLHSDLVSNHIIFHVFKMGGKLWLYFGWSWVVLFRLKGLLLDRDTEFTGKLPYWFLCVILQDGKPVVLYSLTVPHNLSPSQILHAILTCGKRRLWWGIRFGLWGRFHGIFFLGVPGSEVSSMEGYLIVGSQSDRVCMGGVFASSSLDSSGYISGRIIIFLSY